MNDDLAEFWRRCLEILRRKNSELKNITIKNDDSISLDEFYRRAVEILKRKNQPEKG